jgi:hypothetical protein
MWDFYCAIEVFLRILIFWLSTHNVLAVFFYTFSYSDK